MVPAGYGWTKMPDAEWIALCEAGAAEADKLGKHDISQELRELITQIRAGTATTPALPEQGGALGSSSGSVDSSLNATVNSRARR